MRLGIKMQTFLPYADFEKSAAVLDRQRLGKQRVEAKQILLALSDPAYGWQNHPAVKMWRGHTYRLAQYGFIICEEWRRRGYKDSLRDWFATKMKATKHEGGLQCIKLVYENGEQDWMITSPAWLGNPAFHASHRSNLLRKMPQHYRQYWPDETDTLEYVWPINGSKG